jgi:hypothetical protein
MLNEEFGYKNQLERLKRYREKLNDYSVNQLEYKDILWSFFQNAYHLKDWIKNDGKISLKYDVENFINENKYIKITADLANRSKHLKLSSIRGNNSDCNKEGVNVFVRTIHLDKKYNIIDNLDSKSTCQYFYIIKNANDESFNHIYLADNILKEWTEFIDKHILEN